MMEGSSWMLPIVALCLGLGFVVGKGETNGPGRFLLWYLWLKASVDCY